VVYEDFWTRPGWSPEKPARTGTTRNQLRWIWTVGTIHPGSFIPWKRWNRYEKIWKPIGCEI
jgi:hypothetical protein